MSRKPKPRRKPQFSAPQAAPPQPPAAQPPAAPPLAAAPPPGLSIDLRQGGNRAAYLGIGWGEAEPHGSWTVAGDATLILPGQDQPAAWVISLLARPYLGTPANPLAFQDLILYVNEVRVLTRRLTDPQMIRCAIPDGAVAPGGPITLRLRCPAATAPRTLGAGGDSRTLGVSIASASMRRAP